MRHKDQDQPETPITKKDYEYWIILKMLINTRLTLYPNISQQQERWVISNPGEVRKGSEAIH